MKGNKHGLRSALILLAALLLVTAAGMFIGNSHAGEGSQFERNNGEFENPYCIDSAADLCALRDAVNAGDSLAGKYVLQTTDIDLSGIENFTPFVNFSGIYNGAGHTVSNLTVTARPTEDETPSYAALFSKLNGTVMNLGIEGGIFSGDVAAGIAAVGSKDAQILNCYSSATVRGGVAGGIAANFEGKLVRCFFDGTCTGTTVGNLAAKAGALIACNAPSPLVAEQGEMCAARNTVGMPDESVRAALRGMFAENSYEAITPQMQLGSLFFEGWGVEQAPYLISTTDDFCLFRDLVNAGCPFLTVYFRQTADLDLSSVENWTPIGIVGGENYFCGVYDGAGHTISNLTIHSEDDFVGLFGNLCGKIHNLGIESGTITGGFVGSFASGVASSEAEIVNCYSNADLIATQRAGGIGDYLCGIWVVSCYFSGTVSAPEAAGIVSNTAERVVGCYAVNCAPLAGPAFRADYGTGEVSSRAAAISATNHGRFNALASRTMLGETFYRFSDAEGFGGVCHVGPLFLLLELAVLLLIVLLSLTVILFRRRFSAAKQLPGAALRDLWGSVRGGLAEATDTRLGRMRFAFLSVFTFCSGMIILGIVCRDRAILNAAVYSGGEDVFMDFFNPMHTVLTRNVRAEGHYGVVGETYPPMARAVLWLFGQLLPSRTATASALTVRTSAYGLFSWMLFLALCLIPLYLVAVIRGKELLGKKGRFVFPLLVLLCPSLIFAIERGNVMLLAFALSVLFVSGYRSTNPWIRQAAYACLALAAAIKIYPVVLGLLVVREKNAKHTVQCVAWGVVFCLFPFVFCGGWTSLCLYIRNVSVAFDKFTVRHDPWLLNCSNTMVWLGQRFAGSGAVGEKLSGWILYPLTALLAGCALFSPTRWKAALAAVLILLLFPGFSLYYMGVFLLIPIAMLLKEPNPNRHDVFFLVLAAAPILPLQFLCGAYGVDKYFFPTFSGIVLLVTALLLVIDCAVEVTGALSRRFRQNGTKSPSTDVPDAN